MVVGLAVSLLLLSLNSATVLTSFDAFQIEAAELIPAAYKNMAPPIPFVAPSSVTSTTLTTANDLQTITPLPSFDLFKSTEENYRQYPTTLNFYGRYTHIRSTLDYTYHSNYTPQRQLLQDSIIYELLHKNNSTIVDSNGKSCISPKNPWIVFTAGAMGSGKSYTIRHLAARDRFPLHTFITVDPDEIRRMLPEFEHYLNHDPETAGEYTAKEAGLIAEMLTLVALQESRNVLVDGSLKDSDWYKDYFSKLRNDFGDFGLRIGVLHITAPREAVFERARMRSKITKRVVPKHTLEETIEMVPRSVDILAPLADFSAELHNAPNADDIELVRRSTFSQSDIGWTSFRQVWDQSCDIDKRTKPAHGRTDNDVLVLNFNAWIERLTRGQMLPMSKL
mmetsp:Transcript_15017/g.21985  ORF Transcript_15017/g.21985 Transcript_15017/m.21985 type:complete len:393 (+) Transcript_15017:1-1179(+)